MQHRSLTAFSERNYRMYLLGWLPASIGLTMQATALAWEVYERTGDALALGIIGLARSLPTVILALPAGQIVDLIDRRRVLMTSQICFALTGLLLASSSFLWENGSFGPGNFGLHFTYVLVALTGCARVFYGPTRASLLPHLFEDGATSAKFQNAVTWNSAAFQSSMALGPILGGSIIALTGNAWSVYILTCVNSLWFVWILTRIQPYNIDLGTNADSRTLFEAIKPSVILPGMLEGVRHILHERTVFGAIVLDLFAVLLGGATALMPIYAKDILAVGPIGLGALKSAPYIGAIVMALVLTVRAPLQNAGPALLWSVAGFGICTIVFGFSTNFGLSLAMLATLGALDNISVIVRHVLVSVRSPDHLRGRVSAVNSVFIECSNELGGFESGLVANFFGPVASVISGGIGTVLVVLLTAWKIPELRALRRLE